MTIINKLLQVIFSGIIRVYQYTLSPILGPSCRFYPSCSHYGYEAIQKHGLIKGGWLAVTRIGRCHPFNPGGIDEVPEVKDASHG